MVYTSVTCSSSRWRVKSVEQSIAETDDPNTKLRKNLNWLDLTIFGVSVVIGAGIFTITASTAANVTGPAISLSFIIASIVCGLAALCYAEFASTIPVAGSAYTFAYATFGEFIAWIIGWDLILEFALAASVVAKGWSSYLSTIFSFTKTFNQAFGFHIDFGALFLVVLATFLLIGGTKLSVTISTTITFVKVIVVLIVVIVGAFYIKIENYFPFIPPTIIINNTNTTRGLSNQTLFSLLFGTQTSQYGWYGVLSGASIVFFAFVGFDIVAATAEETKCPQRDIPKGILASLGVVTVLYVAVSVILSGMVKYTELRDSETQNLATAFILNNVNWAAQLISIGAIAGLTTVVIVLILGQTRVMLAMSRDGLLPCSLSRTSRKGTPIRVTFVVGSIIAFAAAFFPVDNLKDMVNIGTLFAFVLVSAGVVLLRYSRPDIQRNFRLPFMPILPLFSILSCLWLMLNLTAMTWFRFGIWMILGIVIYIFYGYRNSILGNQVNLCTD